MRYGFVRLVNDDGSFLFMEIRDFVRYRRYDVFNDHADTLCIFDNIHIGGFPLVFRLNEILEFNPDAFLYKVFPRSKCGFWSTYAIDLGCVNV